MWIGVSDSRNEWRPLPTHLSPAWLYCCHPDSSWVGQGGSFAEHLREAKRRKQGQDLIFLDLLGFFLLFLGLSSPPPSLLITVLKKTLQNQNTSVKNVSKLEKKNYSGWSLGKCHWYVYYGAIDAYIKAIVSVDTMQLWLKLFFPLLVYISKK